MTRLFEDGLRPHGLRATQFSVLAALAIKGPTAMGVLADALGLERTTLTRSVDLLGRNAWVRTVPSSDARARTLMLTASGRRKVENAFPAWQAVQAQLDRELATATPHM